MNRIRVAFDIDGCLYPWSEGVREALIELGHDLAGVDMDGTSWDHVKGVIGDEAWQWIFSDEGAQATLYRTHLMYPGTTEALHALAGVADLSFITHRSPNAAAATALWLAEHDVPFTSLHILGRADRNHDPKSSVEPKAHIYVEDNSDNVRELVANTDALVMAPRRPYNTDLEPLHANSTIVMYDDLSQVVRTARWMAAIVGE